jgi:hypothetical protein
MSWLEQNCPRLARAQRTRRNELEFWRRVGELPAMLRKWEDSMRALQRAAIPASEAVAKFTAAWKRGL